MYVIVNTLCKVDDDDDDSCSSSSSSGSPNSSGKNCNIVK